MICNTWIKMLQITNWHKQSKYLIEGRSTKITWIESNYFLNCHTLKYKVLNSKQRSCKNLFSLLLQISLLLSVFRFFSGNYLFIWTEYGDSLSISYLNTAWKVSKYGVISGPYFPVFGLNTERYGVSLHIESKYRKIRTRNNTVFGHFSRSVEFIAHRKKYFNDCAIY